jgi:dTDP-4-amino-4,6-dideoxygalactose transaminase
MAAPTVNREENKVRVPLVNLSRQHEEVQDKIQEAFAEILRTSSFIGGPWLDRFEEDFARYCGTRFALGVSSGTAALELALRASGIGPGDEVLVPSFTYIATAASVSAVGATPVFVDIDPASYTLSGESAEQHITPRTRGMIPVHLYGQAADMGPIAELARRHNLILIEDAAQAQGAQYLGKPMGSWGLATGFSFYPAKNLGAWGDAGAIITQDEGIAERVRLLRNHGSSRDKYCHEILGFNHRLDTLQAAVLSIKLKYLDRWNESRREAAARYLEALAGLDLILPSERPGSKHVYHVFVIRTPRRDALRDFLKLKGIDAGLYYPVPLHLQPAYRHMGHRAGDFPIAEQAAREVISLPISPRMTPAEVECVAEAVGDFFRRAD